MLISTRGQWGYACGMLGWSILINIIAVMLVYFYVPPNNAALPMLIPQITIFGIFTILSIILAAGRLLDAITDPVIAFWSDQLRHPRGRRIPFMRLAVFPSIFFAVLLFTPVHYHQSQSNIWWLALIQAGFYLSLTAYIIPYNALLPELAPGNGEKVRLSTLLSLAFVTGIILSSQTPLLADIVQKLVPSSSRHEAFQLAIGLLCVLAGGFMVIPVFSVDEKKHTGSSPASLPLRYSLKQIIQNRNFRVFILADFSYFVSITIISSGMLYFVRVLLFLEESVGGQVMGVMVIVSLLFYPTVIRMAEKFGKRRLMVFSLCNLALLLFGITFLGKLPIPPKAQIFGFAVLAAAPMAFLGILPYAIIAEIAEEDGRQTGQQKEAMYFAVRNFSTKLGQTFGIMVFAILTLVGKDPHNDWGIRLAAVFGAGLCLLAGLTFIRFRETREPNIPEWSSDQGNVEKPVNPQNEG